jgi:microcystin-dependent protein
MVCRRIKVPAASDWLELINGALAPLMNDWNWEPFGTMSVHDTVQAFRHIVLDYLESTDYCMIGAIFPYVTQTPPANALPCDGSTYNRVDYPDLYAKLDTAFIVDADHFQTPDLRGRTVIGAGAGDGLTERQVGDVGGAETVSLTEAQLASHSHTTNPHSHSDSGHVHGTISVPVTVPVFSPGEAPVAGPTFPFGNTGLGFANISATTVDVNATGAGEGHQNMPPFVALKYCIVAK